MSNEPNGLRQRYFRTLNVNPAEPSQRERTATALACAYRLRTFEIEHYWKRATYFWGFQIVIFAAFGFLWTGTSATAAGTGWHPVAFALTGLGVLTALANSLSARGSKFWQENWERHIDMLEDEIDGRLHKTVWLDKGRVSFSVSRINQLLSDYVVGFWVIVAAYVGWASLGALPLGWISSARTYVPVLTIITYALHSGAMLPDD